MKFFESLFSFERAETAGDRVFFRIFELFVGLATIYLTWQWGMYTLLISDIVLPLGIARFVDVSFMFGNNLPLWNAATITLLVAFAFFRVPWLVRYGYALAFLLLLFQYAARYSLGEIPHSSNMAGMTLLGIALGRVVFGLSKDARRFALGFTYFFVGLGYTLAACSKLVASGPTWVSGQHLWMWINEKAIDLMAKTGVFEYNWLQELLLEHYWMATAVLTFGLLCEALAFLVWWPRFRTPIIFAILGLHIGIFYSMNIIFKLSMLELILLGLPWGAWIDKLADSPVGAMIRNRRHLTSAAH